MYKCVCGEQGFYSGIAILDCSFRYIEILNYFNAHDACILTDKG